MVRSFPPRRSFTKIEAGLSQARLFTEKSFQISPAQHVTQENAQELSLSIGSGRLQRIAFLGNDFQPLQVFRHVDDTAESIVARHIF